MAVEEYLTEEEQAEALKKWFSENWLWMAAGVVIALLGLAGWQRYQAYKADRAANASQLLEQMTTTAATDDSKASSLLKQLSTDYASTPYADQAHLLVAQRDVQSGKFEQAATELRVVMESGHDEQLRSIARLRLVRVLIQLQKLDEALQLLNPDKAGAFAGASHELRGDVFFAKGDRKSARAEYQAALDAYKTEPAADTNLLQLKADDLNSDETVATTSPAAK
jgi:predicted negative regulator of RcsB-dependent stress response